MTAGSNAPVPTNEIIVRIISDIPTDISAFCLHANGKVSGDADMVFYGNKQSHDQALALVDEGVNTTFKVNLPKINPLIQKIAFSYTCHSGQSISSLARLSIQIEQETVLLEANIDLKERTEAALILGELYRKNNEWKFRFISQGFSGGLKPLAEFYGVEVAQDQVSSPASNQTTVSNSVPASNATPSSSAPVNASANTSANAFGGQTRPRAQAQEIPGFGNHRPTETRMPTQETRMPRSGTQVPTSGTRIPTQAMKTGVNDIFDKVKSTLSAGREELTAQVSRYKNRKFMEGTVAVCACISSASNGVSSEEKQKMIAFIQQSPELKVFETKEIIEFFNSLAASFDFDTDIGKGESMKFIVRLKDQPDEAQLAFRVGIAVAKSDGDFDDAEKAVAREICSALGLNPADYQL